MKFTSKSIAALQLPAGKSEVVVWDPDLPNFGVRLRPASKTWRIQYRVGRQQRSESLGDIRKVSLDDARRIAKQRFAKVELGEDPGAQRDAARREALEAKLTVGNVAARYLEAKQDRLRRSSYTAAARYLQDYATPLHACPLADLKRAQVAIWIDDLIDKHGYSPARDARRALSALFNWAMRQGYVEINPVSQTNDPGTGLKSRDRILNDGELAIVWQVCDAVDDDFCRVLKLALFTCCRRAELGGLRWDEVDLQSGKLTLPGERTKNHRPHELILPEPALAILRSQPRIAGRDWVFGRDGAGLTAWSLHKARFDKLVAEATDKRLLPWTVHDLRRTAATRMAEFTAPHIVEEILNHVSGHKAGVAGIYNRASYASEKQRALALWAERLLGIVENRPPKVVALPQRA
jgi:integrase